MQLSIIILNYNVRYFLEQCVLSVQKAIQDIDGEIIVVDNNSSDDSCAMMKQRFPNVKLIENKENLGFPKGNNIGVAEAKGEYICILNPDTVVAEDTFSKVIARYEAISSSVGIIGCKLIDGTGNFLPECKRGVPTPWVALTKIFGLYQFFPKSSLFNKYYAQHLSESESGKVDILVGAFMVMKRELYLEVGGFDENCFMYSDDIDLSYMVLKSGNSNFYFHETSVIHYKGESTVRDEKYVQRFREAMQFFYKKHFGGSFLFNVLMKIGAFVFSIVKKSQQKNTIRKTDKIIFFSKEEKHSMNLKYDEIKNDFNQFENIPKQNIEIIFDIQSFSYKEIIAFMEKYKANNLTFKNYIPNSEFLIGSNHANDIGQVINLTKND
ncbi:glycosyltransferase family 2 protein [Flavobacterium amnicola]|uniref:Glycosyltransferase family 2 protein n=1 Tax=Flavobacterium amnicola TaxID=2506422 RepID=A0A4Q1K265_9FLAO|nr:glycosyltransferase family 2 protein [Flavobacterium amnicola]RXR18385.1 glycosyltransferase family 2 protein [Flavobacterium amnicola]